MKRAEGTIQKSKKTGKSRAAECGTSSPTKHISILNKGRLELDHAVEREDQSREISRLRIWLEPFWTL